MDYKSGVCNFCGTGCGNYLRISDGKITGVYSSRNHPVSKGRLCVRGWHIHEWLMTDQRISSPMIKVDGSFKNVTYEEAVNFMMEKLSPYMGSSAKAIGFLGAPRWSNENNYLFMKLARSVFKTNNITLDSESGHRGSLNVLSKVTGFPAMTGSLEQIEKTKFIMVIGSDLTRINPIIGSEIHKAQMAGTKVVTLGSRKTQMAKLSNLHLQCRPGTLKLTIALIAKVAIEKGYMDKNFASSVAGFNDFASSLAAINMAEAIGSTGISLDEIDSVAKELCGSESAMAFWSTGISGADEDTVSYIANLFLVAGKVGKENCGLNSITGLANLQGGYDMGVAPDLLTGFQSYSDGAVRSKFEKAWQVQLPADVGNDVYQLLENKNNDLKVLFVAEHDEGIVKYEKEIANLDFVVYFGSYDNPFVNHADVVFPIAALIEDDGTYTNTERRVQISQKRIEAFNGVLSVRELFSMIAAKSGVKWSYNSSEDVFKEIASLTPSYSGLSYDKLINSTGIQWPCNSEYPNGCKSFLLKSGTALSFAKVSGTFPAVNVSEAFPFLLISGRGEYFWHQNNIMKKSYIPKREYNATLLVYPKGFIEINSEDAKKLQVREHWSVKISSDKGSMKVSVKISEDVKPGTAYVPYFIKEMITDFLLGHSDKSDMGLDATIPVRIERV
ncbi:MAG TPA: molybdopterin-dependent oxidoreductase [Spirochaetota bacterium]|nr:molybdopterin-dependent oxidoreductase [Spirochaetota bacterium]HPP94432.1 molybdopterin-dependent oxidoreductase [Spirochaetota bacterium]